MSKPLSDQLQVWGFESGLIIFSDCSLGFGLELIPIDITCQDDEQVDALTTRLCHVLNGLPAGIDLQFIQDIKPGSADTLREYDQLQLTSLSDTTRALHANRLEFLQSQENGNLIPFYRLRLFVRRHSSTALLDKPSLFSRTKKFTNIAEERLEHEITQAHYLQNEIVSSLKSLGLIARPYGEKEIVELIYSQWNPSRPVELENYDPEDLRNSILFEDVQLYEAGFLIGDVHHRIISLKMLPEQSTAAFAQALSELPFGSRLCLSISVSNQQQEIERLQRDRRLAFSMARGKKGARDIDSEAKLEDLESLLDQMVASGEKVFNFSLSVILQAKTRDELEEQISLTLIKIREMNGCEAMVESFASFDIFSDLSIPNAASKERSKRIKTSNLADFLPLYGPWYGHQVPRILLKSAYNSLLKFDPFSLELTNANQIVAGGSGSGKSFLTNLLILQMLKEDPRVFIIDIGGSYKKLCNTLDGQYIQLNIDSDVSLNPFDLASGETSPPPSKIKFLVGLVELCCKEVDEPGLDRLQRAEIEQTIQQIYETHKSPTLSHLKEELRAHKNEDVNRLGKILNTWCGNTPYGRFIDSKTTLELGSNLVSFDLKGLTTYPDLQKVFLYLITDYLWRLIQADRARFKFVIFDECWQLLENDAGASFIEECYRTFRKYNASAIGISQNIDDFARSKVATAILSNSATKWILMQRGADQARLQEVLQLNDNEMHLIATLHQRSGEYSQAFLMTGDQHQLVYMEPTPLEYWFATTSPKDLHVFEEMQKKYPNKSQIEILVELPKKYPKGADNNEPKDEE